MKAAVPEDTVPIQSDFPTHEEQERDRSEPLFRGSGHENPGLQASSGPACTVG
jgi:hypothetical protein